MIFRKKNIIKFLLPVYFLLYIVSPLCYAEDRLSEDSSINHAAKYNASLPSPLTMGESGEGISVIWELILPNRSHKKDTEDRCPGVHFFIKKGRAVLSSKNTIKAAQLESEAPSLTDYFPRIESVISSAGVVDAAPQHGFYSSFSGLSPPRI